MGGKNHTSFNGSLGGGSAVQGAGLNYTASSAHSGATEPAWPTSYGATIVDNEMTWTAIYARVVTGTITGIISGTMFQHNKTAFPSHYWQYGIIKFLTGRNAGFSCAVRDSYGQVTVGGITSQPYVQLLEVPPNLMSPSDTFVATVGCNKSRGSCQNFNNYGRYRGFPDMPTEDRALSTPNQMSHGYQQNQNRK